MAFAKEKHLRKGERKRSGMIELEQYLANYLLNTSRREVHHKYPGNNNYNRKYPFAVEQMTYEESAIIHNKVDHEQYVQQTVDEILARSLRRISAMTIQKAWRIYKGRDTQLYFANLVKATLKIGRAFRKYRACKKDKQRLIRLREARSTYFSDGSDSDSTSQDETYNTDDEEDYRDDYDSGSFIRLPRKAYAAQKIQSCFRGNIIRKKCLELYTLVKSAQICISRHWRGYQARLFFKSIRRRPFQKLVVEIGDHDTWEHQLELIRNEAQRREMPIVPYKYTSPEKKIETNYDGKASPSKKNSNDTMDDKSNNRQLNNNQRIIAHTTLIYRSDTGWKSNAEQY